MSLEETTRPYHHRCSYAPKSDDTGNVIHIEEPTELDDARFEALAPYDYQTAEFVAALTSCKTKPTTDRFGILKCNPHRWVNVADPIMEKPRRWRLSPLAYSLNPKSVKRLRKLGKEINSYGASGTFTHKLMANWIRAGFDIATKIEKVPATIIPWHEIITSPNVPDQTRDAKTPYQIPVPFEGKTIRVIPDVYPFALKTDDYALLLVEADCDSEDIENQIDLKFKKYLAMFDERVIEKRFGFTKSYVLFVTTSVPHMTNVMRHLAKLTEDKPYYRKRFLFKRHPSIESEDKPRATGHILTEPWQRAMLPSFNLLTKEEQ